jgi:hypothetical protein
VVHFQMNVSAFVTVFRSKSPSFTHERQMYKPFTEVMNYALEPLSRIEVDGLPKFKSHIAFVPCDKGVKSDCDISGSSFKPDVAVMSIQDAYKLYKLDGSDAPELSKLITEISVNAPSGSPSWKTILSAIEIKRGRGSSKHQDRATQDVDVQFDEELGDSQPVVACKFDAFPCGHMLTTLYSNVFSVLCFI